MFDRDVVVLRLIRQRNETDEAAGLVLQISQLAQMIHAVGEGFDMAEEHRAGAAPAHLVPGAVDVQVFVGGFLAARDGGAHFLAENFRAAAGERIEPGGLEFRQRFRHGFFGEPGQMQNFNGREAFQLQARVERAQRPQHVRVITEGQRRMQPADDVQFRDAERQRLARLLDNFLDGMLEAVGVALFAGEGAELAAQDAVIGVIDVAVDDVAGAIADLALPRPDRRSRRRRSGP